MNQQLDLARTEADRASADLAAKTEEYAQHRRQRHAEISALQAQYDNATAELTSTTSSLTALQTAHNTLSHQHSQALARVQALSGQLAEQDATYAAEAAGLKRLVRMLEEREESAKAVMERVEQDWDTIGSRTEAREAALQEEINELRDRAEKAEREAQHLDGLLRRFESGEVELPNGHGTPIGNKSMGMFSLPGTPARGDALGQSMFALSPTVALAGKSQKSGKTFTEVYSDYVRLQEAMATKTVEYEHMEVTLANVLAQIEERVSWSRRCLLRRSELLLGSSPCSTTCRV